MTERHTPGPWQYLGTDITDGPVIKTTVSGVIDDDEVLGTSEWCRLEDADGRLMAAAPELLERLTHALEKAEAMMRGEDDLGSDEDFMEWLEGSRIAVAKATGEDND